MLSACIVFTMATVQAQFRKIPAVVTDAFKAKYNNAASVSWKDKITSFQADFKVGDRTMKSTFSSKGDWLKTESRFDYQSLPGEVKDGFKKSKYASLVVLEVVKTEEPDNDTQYRVIIKKTELGKRSLVFSKSGQLVSDNSSF